MIKWSHQGDFSKTERFLERAKGIFNASIFDKYGKAGVDALAASTPKDTGTTADSWYYEVKRSGNRVEINWGNSNINQGVLIAVILQYGHGTGTGGYVRGTDYINPAIKPVFDQIANELWKEVEK